MKRYQQHSPPHPGEILKELYMRPLNLSLKELSRISSINLTELADLVQGNSDLRNAISRKLSKTFDTTPDLWLGMQKSFDIWKLSNNEYSKE